MPYFTSKERVERDGVLIYAEGDEIPATDLDELKRQGYAPDDAVEADANLSTERVERDGVLVYAEGDPIPDDDLDELKRQGFDVKRAQERAAAEPAPEPAPEPDTAVADDDGAKPARSTRKRK